MDFLNHAFRQLKDLFNSMTPGARITAGLLLILIVTSLAYLFRYSSPTVDEPLLAGQPFFEGEMTAAAAAFALAGLTDYEVNKGRILIPRGKSALYVGALAAGNALPADFNDYLDEAAKGSSVFDSRHVMDQRAKHLKMKRMKLVIEKMPNIQFATVEYDEMKKRGFHGGKEVTAAVAVAAVGGKELSSEQIKGIKQLVAASVVGLSPKDVTLTDMKTSKTYGSSSEGGLAGVDDDPYAARKKMYQKEWEAKISKALGYIEGVIVSVNVELTPDMHHQQDKISYDPKKSIAVSSQEATESSSTTRPSTTGRPGVNGQGNVAISSQTNNIEDSLETSLTDTETRPGGDRVSTLKAPLIPSRVKAVIVIPSTYHMKIWGSENPPVQGQPPVLPTKSDLATIESDFKKKVEDTVLPLLKQVAAGDDPYPFVQVTTFKVFPDAPIPEPTMGENATAWLGENWSTLGMVFVGMFSLLMLRSMVKSVPPVPPPGEAPPVSLSLVGGEDFEDEDSENPEQAARRRFSSSGPNLRDELANMVEEDLDASVNILRNWIGDVG